MCLGGSHGQVCHTDCYVAAAVDCDADDVADSADAVEAVNVTVVVVGRVDVDDAGT